jgi:type III pantothenate kinase
MNLILDIGNTRTKIAIFSNGQLKYYTAISEISVDYLAKLIDQQGEVHRAIVAATGAFGDEVKEWLQQNISFFLQLSADLSFPFQIKYRTRHTLGNDRIAGVSGAQVMFPHKNCLVIDAGTAITYDLIDAEGIYWGGNISPGISMRFQALHTFTQKLPLIHAEGEIPTVGYSTETAIRSGVVLGVIYEIERYIRELVGQYNDLQILLTGGDAVFLADKINYPIFADEFLVLKGLNTILEYNAHT